MQSAPITVFQVIVRWVESRRRIAASTIASTQGDAAGDGGTDPGAPACRARRPWRGSSNGTMTTAARRSETGASEVRHREDGMRPTSSSRRAVPMVWCRARRRDDRRHDQDAAAPRSDRDRRSVRARTPGAGSLSSPGEVDDLAVAWRLPAGRSLIRRTLRLGPRQDRTNDARGQAPHRRRRCGRRRATRRARGRRGRRRAVARLDAPARHAPRARRSTPADRSNRGSTRPIKRHPAARQHEVAPSSLAFGT